MGTPREPKAAKYFVALLSPARELLDRVEDDLVPILGAVDRRSEALPWDASQYYEKEMGGGLLRRFVSCEPLASPEKLAEAKLRTQEVEAKYSMPSGGRRINLDPGYLDSFKVVLASTKNASQRIYLRSGIYAEATLFYHDGGFHGLPYTYADYLWPMAGEFFTEIRATYLAQLRRWS